MNNKEAFKRFGNAHSAQIEKLFWIAGSVDQSDMSDFLSYELTSEFLEKLFPNVSPEHIQEHIDEYSAIELFLNNDKFGLIGEVLIPICNNFTFNEEGDPVTWSTNLCRCRIKYVYAETMEELLVEVEKFSTELFQQFVSDFKKSKAKQS